MSGASDRDEMLQEARRVLTVEANAIASLAERVGEDFVQAVELIDAEGATVLPGLIESHGHVSSLGGLLEKVNLTGTQNEEEAVALVVERAKAVPEGPPSMRQDSWSMAPSWTVWCRCEMRLFGIQRSLSVQ